MRTIKMLIIVIIWLLAATLISTVKADASTPKHTIKKMSKQQTHALQQHSTPLATLSNQYLVQKVAF